MPPLLLADIGGTNARFALVRSLDAPHQFEAQQSLPCSEFASLHHAVEHYLQLVGATPKRAAIAVACPVVDDEVRLTNRAWAFSQRELKATLALDELSVINDFGAIAWAATALSKDDVSELYGDASLPTRGPISLIGPGTGLGVALLVGAYERSWQVVETEGGHASFSPQNDEEQWIAQWVSGRFGRCSNERLLSGQGLSHIDAALRAQAEPAREAQRIELRDPGQIVSQAIEGHDVMARRTLARFCAILGSVVGDIALIHGARHVMIAGGIVPRFIPFVRTSAFRERYLAKGRFADYLAKTPIHVMTHPYPGLLGAAVALLQKSVLRGVVDETII
jgi:glucokinase